MPAAAAGSVLLVLYGTMVGFSVSACRAIGMYLIRMLGEVAGRTYDMLTALGVMAAVMVAGNPFYLHSSGFLLSFGSVLGLGVVCPALFPERPRKPSGAGNAGKTGKPSFWEWVQGAVLDKIRSLPEKAAVALGQSLRASISITLATLPIQLWFYYEVPTYSVFLNLLVIPFVKPLMILGLAAMGVPGLGFLAGVDCLILGGYEFLCGCFDRLPFRAWNPGCPQLWQVAVYYLVLWAAAGLRVWRKRKGKGDPGPVILVCLGVWLLGLRPPLENSVAFLDVGQGDCIYLADDSGGHYLEGSTDITRTFALGPLTEEMKKHFTLVLRAMLNLKDTRFLYGCRGVNLDIRAREVFWEQGLDYKHGTGHGVGYLLNVHEGPNGFRWKLIPDYQQNAVLEEGMVTTDEPGIYIEGSHGVRIENELLCRKGEANEYGQFMYFEDLTYVPIDLEAVDISLLEKKDKERLNRYHREVFGKLSPYFEGEELKWLKLVTREIE